MTFRNLDGHKMKQWGRRSQPIIIITDKDFLHIVLWQAGGFSLEVNNTNPSNVMVGVRVLVGSQSIERAPSYIDIFGRTLPVYFWCLLLFVTHKATK